jgi:hypothetical protein
VRRGHCRYEARPGSPCSGIARRGGKTPLLPSELAELEVSVPSWIVWECKEKDTPTRGHEGMKE